MPSTIIEALLTTMNSIHKSEAMIEERKGDASSGGTSSVDVPTTRDGRSHGAPVHRRDLDQAYWYVQESGSHRDEQATPAELKALRVKIDWRIVPIMFCCYTMQFIDKVSLNVGSYDLSR